MDAFCLNVFVETLSSFCFFSVQNFFLNDRSQKKLSRLHVTYEGTIESNGQGMLQVSLYNSRRGFMLCLCHFYGLVA